MELIEDELELVGRNAGSLIQDVEAQPVLIARAADAHNGAGLRIFGRVVEQVEQHLLEQGGVDLDHGQIGRHIELDPMLG